MLDMTQASQLLDKFEKTRVHGRLIPTTQYEALRTALGKMEHDTVRPLVDILELLREDDFIGFGSVETVVDSVTRKA